MAICITCAQPISHLYTVYESAYNLRLEQCSKCLAFADPYVEHDALTLLLDLILLKRGVYLHLLYNRGTEPRKAYEKINVLDAQLNDTTTVDNARQKALAREKARWLHILKLGSGLVLVDAFIRWAQLNPHVAANLSQWSSDTSEVFLRILVACLIAETVTFHAGVVFASYIVLGFSDWIGSWKSFRSNEVSGIRQQFKVSHIPLAIIYSSFTKSFLLFLLTIWRPSISLPGNGPYRFDAAYENPWILSALEIWDEDKLDREWVVRNVLGGMAAGFGLRVVLDCHPIFTTMVILVGWAVKTAVAEVLKDWVGTDPQIGEVWLAYSIP
ncbi:Arv1-like family-domain-containing protein [Boletus edulis BED1]|uniref:Protein ARV n=1 Tax=Boletus edulis BED1 TaxID=1328754 RepID=A0AAD4BX39_BOLED|nr:Arv1-like family-domain-containing protein [Boletus edulis BED1]